ncbi:MAG: ribonuclease III [Cyanobacteriota bacterium]|nr:ribonuclease III [Cyanobacteriota bacterium]
MADFASISPPPGLRRCLQRLGLPADLEINWQRLDLALTHASVDSQANYERLELLGDAVLRLAVTEYLQEAFPQATVGQLSALSSVLVSDRTLAQLAESLGLEAYLLSHTPNRSPYAVAPPARLADALEAVLAVLYLETHTLELIRPWLYPHLQRLAVTIQQDPAHRNYKDALQVLTQAQDHSLPQYRTREVHPLDSHPQRYQSQVWWQDNCWGTGHGPTKKQAEQAAAAIAYGRLQKQQEYPGLDDPTDHNP